MKFSLKGVSSEREVSFELIFVILLGILALYFVCTYSPKKRKRKKKENKKKCVFSKEKILLNVNSFVDIKNMELYNIKIKELIILLLKESDLYFLCRVNSDKEESKIKNFLIENFSNNNLKEHKILFCETEKGKIAIARSIECFLYVELILRKEQETMTDVHLEKKKDFNFFLEISRFIPRVACVNMENPSFNEDEKENIEKITKSLFITSNFTNIFNTTSKIWH